MSSLLKGSSTTTKMITSTNININTSSTTSRLIVTSGTSKAIISTFYLIKKNKKTELRIWITL